MDDRFLIQFREDPRPEFVEGLRGKLSQHKVSAEVGHWPLWQSPVLATLSVLLTLVVLLSFPTLRAAAEQLFELFRVRHYVAISFDPTRIEQLDRLYLRNFINHSIRVVKREGEQTVESLGTAGKIVNIQVRVPTELPNGLIQTEIEVRGEAAAVFTLDVLKLQEILNILGITDLELPQQLNFANVSGRLPSAVVTRYTNGQATIVLIQSRSPEIVLPEGMNLPQLIEIGLRIVGLRPDEAKRWAHSVDWQGTMLVPVPDNAASFREVELRNAKGLLIEEGAARGPSHLGGSSLRWSESGMVYALEGRVPSSELIKMANSLQ